MNLTKRRVLGSVDLLLLKEIGANRRQPCCLLLLAFCTRVRSEPTRNWTEPRLAQARSSSFLIFYSDCNPSPPSSPATALRRQRPPMEGLSGAESIRSSVNLGSLQLGEKKRGKPFFLTSSLQQKPERRCCCYAIEN